MDARRANHAYQCVCGRSFPTYLGLSEHQRRYCAQLHSNPLALREVRELHAAQQSRVQAPLQQAQEAERKRTRDDQQEDDRIRRVALALAEERYMKLVPGTQIDRTKTLHTTLMKDARASMMQELTQTLGDKVPAAILETIDQVAAKHFDLYKGLRTAKQERTYLNKILERPKFHPRELPQGGTAYDFEIDGQLLLLLKYSSVAREQFHETLRTWRTAHQWTRDDPKRIFVDIIDSDVARDHEVLGDAKRMSPEEAAEAAKTGPFQFGIVLWSDAFVVSNNAPLCQLQPSPAACATSVQLAGPAQPSPDAIVTRST